jgi:ubiquinone/menaquinone biosynthesis C-methylase UbiE
MNKYLPYSEFSKIARTLLSQKWIFAKTMPQNPHHYALRENFYDDALFDATVAKMREYSYVGRFGGRQYQYFNINENFYWTMGEPIPTTILINRKLRGSSPYDEIASRYIELFSDKESQKENDDVLNLLDYKGGSVLEIGCACCPLISALNIDRYCGVDPSKKMLEICRQKYPGIRFIQSDFESLYDESRYDYIVATFGAASYIQPEYLQKVFNLVNSGGKIFLMFYKDDYTPKTYEKTGVSLNWYKGNFKTLTGEVKKYHNYIIFTDKR